MLATRNFRESEFYVHETPPAAVITDKLPRVMALAQWLRDVAGVPGVVASYYRNPGRNAAVGGVAASQHMLGEATDVSFLLIGLGALVERIFAEIAAGRAPAFGQLIVYRDTGHIHISLSRSATSGKPNGQLLYSPGPGADGVRIYRPLLKAVQVPAYSEAQKKGGVAALVILLLLALVAWRLHTRGGR